MPAGPERRHPLIQERVLPIQAVPQDMKFASAVERADFDSRDDLDAQLLAGRDRLGNTAGNVMVGDGQRRDTGFTRQLQHF